LGHWFDAQGPMTLAKMGEPTPNMMSPTRTPKSWLFQFLKKYELQDFPHLIEGLNSSLTQLANEYWLCKVQQKSGAQGLKGLKRNYIEILGKTFMGRLIQKKQNKQWGYFKTKISSLRAFKWCIAYANSMCAHRVIAIQNLCHAWVILMTAHFLYPTWVFWKFSSQV